MQFWFYFKFLSKSEELQTYKSSVFFYFFLLFWLFLFVCLFFFFCCWWITCFNGLFMCQIIVLSNFWCPGYLIILYCCFIIVNIIFWAWNKFCLNIDPNNCVQVFISECRLHREEHLHRYACTDHSVICLFGINFFSKLHNFDLQWNKCFIISSGINFFFVGNYDNSQ